MRGMRIMGESTRLHWTSKEWNLVAANLKHIEANLADAHGLVDAELDDGNVVVGAG
jgi:hypothetical protein